MQLVEAEKAGFVLSRLSVACLCVWLSACTTLGGTQAGDDEDVSLIRMSDRDAMEVVEAIEEDKRGGRTLLEQKGSGSFINAAAERKPAVVPVAGDRVRVTFEDAPVGAVLEAVLGELLKVPYALEGEVKGQLTLISTDPVPQDVLLDMLESALEVQGVAMVKSDGGLYRIGSSENLRREVPVALREQVATRGYSVRIIPLRYLSVMEAEKILTPLGLKNNILRLDPLRNIMMIGASAPQMQNALRTLNMMDVDVLKGMSFGIYEVANLEADMLVARIEKLMENPELGTLGSAVRLVSLNEINSVMVITPNAEQLSTVREWLQRLDEVGVEQDDDQTGSQLYVYEVQNGEAKYIADLLGQIFSGSSTGTSSSSTSGRVAPGLESTDLSSADGAKSSKKNSKSAASTTTMLGTRIVADETNNSLLIMATAKEWRSIRAALTKIDKLPAQVLIEVSIWEVTLKDELNYGVEWFFNSKNGADILSGKGGLLSMNDAGSVSRSAPGFSYLFSGSDWRAVINALSSRSRVRSLSSPSVLVQDNKEASIQVGNQQPIQTSQTVNTSNTGVLTQNVELKDTGVQLKVKARVNNGGLVIMDINQEVTDVGATDGATGQRSFLKRSIESTVAIQSGDTIILGGLIQDNQGQGDSGVPFLHRLPVLGGLFGTKNDSTNRTELLITISPRAINQYRDFGRIGEEFREKMHGITEAFRQEFTGRMPVPGDSGET